MEIVPPANKDRPSPVDDLAVKATSALGLGVHLLLIDLLPPGPHDRGGIHGAIWQSLDPEADVYNPPAKTPFTLAAYVAGPEVEAHLEPLARGDALPDMPLFLNPERYVNVPLDVTYQAAFQGLPAYWREVLTR